MRQWSFKAERPRRRAGVPRVPARRRSVSDGGHRAEHPVGGEPHAMTVNAFASVSMQPRLVLAAVSNPGPTSASVLPVCSR